MTPEEFQAKWKKAIQHLEEEFAKINLGRASSSLVEHLEVFVPSWWTTQPINQLASIAILDASSLKIEPWDKSVLGAIEKAIRDANLGLTPQNMWDHILVKVPPLTQERRQELGKFVAQLGEEEKIVIRNLRQEALKTVKRQFEEKQISEDEKKRLEKQIDEITKDLNKQIDQLVEAKKKQIMEI